MTREQQEAVVRSITRTCRGPVLEPATVKEDGTWKHAVHQGCGYDVNEMIIKHPFDGVTRKENCPKCNTEQVFHVTPFEN